MWNSFEKPVKIAMIDGKEVVYDACGKNKERAIEFYSNMEYIGEGYIYRIGGTIQASELPKKTYYFFKHK